MGSALTLCGLDVTEGICEEGRMGRTPESAGPKFAIRVVSAPIERSLGASMGMFARGDEGVVQFLQEVRGWAPLKYRHQYRSTVAAMASNTQQGGGGTMRQGEPLWPDSAPMRQLCAKIVRSDGKGGGKVLWCMVQVAVAPTDRTQEVVEAHIEEAQRVASYAHSFNEHLIKMHGGGDRQVEAPPGIEVCAPVAAVVAKSTLPNLVSEGQYVLLVPYPTMEVQKFVFDGTEEFLELPQAFFHYVAWKSSGNELVSDLQGIEGEDGSVLLVNPAVLRAAKPTIQSLITTIAPMATATMILPRGAPEQEGPTAQQFDTLHRRCTPLCSTFDPQRRGREGLGRKHCGLGINCGLGR